MEKSKEEALNDFVGNENEEAVSAEKNVILNKREGLIERVDKVFITEDGRQLLREQY